MGTSLDIQIWDLQNSSKNIVFHSRKKLNLLESILFPSNRFQIIMLICKFVYIQFTSVGKLLFFFENNFAACPDNCILCESPNNCLYCQEGYERLDSGQCGGMCKHVHCLLCISIFYCLLEIAHFIASAARRREAPASKRA